MSLHKLLLLGAICCTTVLSAQPLSLPTPQKNGGMPLMEALSERQSTREFDPEKQLSEQTLSDLLWAAWGYNREDKRTAPSALNKQEISLYVITEQGVYLYLAESHQLESITMGDFRKSAGKQPFVATAPLNLVFVADTDIAPGNDMMFVDCGFISQNIYLYCASAGLGTVVRGSFDAKELVRILKLEPNFRPILTQTVGYPAH